MDKTHKAIRRRRNDCNRKRSLTHLKNNDTVTTITTSENIEYPSGPIEIHPSWDPINRSEKPPYSYATIIGHAILTSKERKLTLHDIYIWISENYPFYSNENQGWQNSIRHNLSLHKAFIKIERDTTSTTTSCPPRKGCFWTIRKGKEKSFIDNLQRALSPLRKQQSTSIIKRQSTSSSRRCSSPAVHRTTAEFPTSATLIPESEPIIVSSSSDQLSSPSSSSLSGSPTYRQLLYQVPEISMSYNVYPEHSNGQHELYGEGDQHTVSKSDSGSSRHSTASYLTESNTMSHLSSSSCDPYRSQDNTLPYMMYNNGTFFSNSKPRYYTDQQHESQVFMNHNASPSSLIEWNSTPSMIHHPEETNTHMPDFFLQYSSPIMKQSYEPTSFMPKLLPPTTSYLLPLSRNNISSNNYNSFHR